MKMYMLKKRVRVSFPKKFVEKTTTVSLFCALNNGLSTVIDHRNSVFDRQKVLFNDHNDRQYLNVTTTFNNVDFFVTCS